MDHWILMITSGQGPVEVRKFVSRLGPHLALRLVERGQRVTADVVFGDPEAPRAMQIRFEGDGEGLSDLLGTHTLVSRSPHRGRKSRKRWFAGVEVFREGRYSIDGVKAEDVVLSTCRAGGPGGQHVNTTASAVQALHLPSGIRVRVESERSQHQNKKRAFSLIRRALAYQTRCELARAGSDRRMAHWRVERGAAVCTYRLDRRGRLLEVRDA